MKPQKEIQGAVFYEYDIFEYSAWKIIIKNFFWRKGSIVRIGAGVVLSQKSFVQHAYSTDFGTVYSFADPEDDDYEFLVHEILKILDTGTSIIVSISLSFPPDMIAEISAHKNCFAIFVRPCITWDQMPSDAQKVFFRIKKSPFSVPHGGFVFGKYVKTFSLEWLRQAKKYSPNKPIIIGGGILVPKDIIDFAKLGASGFVIDRATLLRWWNIPRIIYIAKHVFKKK